MGFNSRRKVYSVLRGAFNDVGITEYVREMTGGRGRITKLRGDALPAINTVEAWDGQDGEVSDGRTVSCGIRCIEILSYDHCSYQLRMTWTSQTLTWTLREKGRSSEPSGPL